MDVTGGRRKGAWGITSIGDAHMMRPSHRNQTGDHYNGNSSDAKAECLFCFSALAATQPGHIIRACRANTALYFSSVVALEGKSGTGWLNGDRGRLWRDIPGSGTDQMALLP